MSLQPSPIPPVPELTARVAHAAFPKGNPYLRLRDELGPLFRDGDFADLYPRRGQPALPPWRLALVTVMQFAEDLSDRQAADAVRGRIDWKYALGLELDDPGFDFSVLSEFRARLIAGGAERLLLEEMLEACKARGLLKARPASAPTRPMSWPPPATSTAWNWWARRSAPRSTPWRPSPGVAARAGPARVVRPLRRAGRGVAPAQGPGGPLRPRGGHRRRRVSPPGCPHAGAAAAWLWQVPAVEVLAGSGCCHSTSRTAGSAGGRRPTWPRRGSGSTRRTTRRRPSATSGAPLDGYKVHVTETCEPDQVHLITNVETTPAVAADVDLTAPIHAALAARACCRATPARRRLRRRASCWWAAGSSTACGWSARSAPT